MTELRTSPVVAIRVDSIDDVRAAGAFEYTQLGDRYPGGMIYACPCGCGQQRSLIFGPAPPSSPERPSWTWDRNMEAPTLWPSVHHVGHWHGFLRNGVWESC